MTDEQTLSIALGLMLLALPLISVGSWNDISVLWWIGLALLGLGASIPPVARFAMSGNGDDNGSDGDGNEEDS